MERTKGFTLIELMVVILIVSILAGVAIPLMQGRIDSAKWSEANAAAGTIRTAVRAYVAEKGLSQAQTDLQNQDVSDVMDKLGFTTNDLAGTYFSASNYSIGTINSEGKAVITVSAGTGLSGTGTLAADGSWTVSSE